MTFFSLIRSFYNDNFVFENPAVGRLKERTDLVESCPFQHAPPLPSGFLSSAFFTTQVNLGDISASNLVSLPIHVGVINHLDPFSLMNLGMVNKELHHLAHLVWKVKGKLVEEVDLRYCDSVFKFHMSVMLKLILTGRMDHAPLTWIHDQMLDQPSSLYDFPNRIREIGSLASKHYGLNTRGPKYASNDDIAKNFPQLHSYFEDVLNVDSPENFELIDRDQDNLTSSSEVIHSDLDCQGLYDDLERVAFLTVGEVQRWVVDDDEEVLANFVEAAQNAKECLYLQQFGC